MHNQTFVCPRETDTTTNSDDRMLCDVIKNFQHIFIGEKTLLLSVGTHNSFEIQHTQYPTPVGHIIRSRTYFVVLFFPAVVHEPRTEWWWEKTHVVAKRHFENCQLISRCLHSLLKRRNFIIKIFSQLSLSGNNNIDKFTRFGAVVHLFMVVHSFVIVDYIVHGTPVLKKKTLAE